MNVTQVYCNINVREIISGGFKQFNELKEANPCLKTLIAIGGWNEGSEKYSLMAETAKGRQNFADSVLRFLVHYGFDGLDVDWEYPTQRGGITDDKENFVELLRTLKETLRRRQKLLTIAIGSTPWIIDTAYEVEEMCDIVDLVMIMAYDIQDPNLLTVHAPLKREDDPDALQLLATIDDGITHLLSLNCPAKKIVLGIGAFGRTFTMKSATEHEIGDPVAGLGKAGPYLRADGSLGFNEICEDQLKNDWTVEQLSGNAMSIAYKGKQWLSYDDETSIEIKAAYAVEHKLGGLMLYSMDTDDFLGNCFGYSYPLLRAINKGLGRNVD